MRKILANIWSDFKKGQNIDLFVTILIGIVISAMSILGLNVTKYLTPITLIILAFIAFNILNTRYLIDDLKKKNGADSFFLKEWDEKLLMQSFNSCNEVFIIGPILLRSTKNFYSLYEELLNKGITINVLITKPNSESVRHIANRPYTNINIKRVQNEINSSIDSYKNLKTTTNAKINIKSIDYPLSYGGFFFNLSNGNSKLFIKNYPFKMKKEDRPKFILSPKDEYWYNYFAEEVKNLWNNALEI